MPPRPTRNPLYFWLSMMIRATALVVVAGLRWPVLLDLAHGSLGPSPVYSLVTLAAVLILFGLLAWPLWRRFGARG
ncbi:hypothetical protein [Phenylobacterium montanum]|uniref:Uncharacterized protein n=1 Tax=Phenylobacterium montanum TaxID=2823693 RepID=A0A975IXB7_9CAUL|nr:hypothetical protein [Caulobacter sp. S6]QUD90464.1 hypothetical protein KCG34_11670 [Caulobacter sp. S6]